MEAPEGVPPPQQVMLGHGEDPLTAAMLAAAPPSEQKKMLGERLYPDLAGKITGMLLEIDIAKLMLEDQDLLKDKVEEAVAVPTKTTTTARREDPRAHFDSTKVPETPPQSPASGR